MLSLVNIGHTLRMDDPDIEYIYLFVPQTAGVELKTELGDVYRLTWPLLPREHIYVEFTALGTSAAAYTDYGPVTVGIDEHDQLLIGDGGEEGYYAYTRHSNLLTHSRKIVAWRYVVPHGLRDTF